jgi:putative acetyltransferase
VGKLLSGFSLFRDVRITSRIARFGGCYLLIIRLETSEDRASIHHVNQAAFGQKEESEIIEKLRDRGILSLSLVAVQDDVVVGHIAFSPVEITSENSSFEAIALAPMAVLPLHQSKWIGSQLVSAGLNECRRLGHEIVFVLGHPNYYPRFGFVLAKSKNIKCEFEVPDEAWMVLELREGALAGRQGEVSFQPEFTEAM